MAESFLADRDLNEAYLPEDISLEDFDFETCTGANCNDITPACKNLNYTPIISQMDKLRGCWVFKMKMGVIHLNSKTIIYLTYVTVL